MSVHWYEPCSLGYHRVERAMLIRSIVEIEVNAMTMGEPRMSRALSRLIATLAWLIASHAVAADKVIYQLGFLPQGANANVYHGVHKGLFAAEGLDVTIISGRGAADTMTKVATGVADMGEATFDVFLAAHAEGPMPAKAVASVFNRPPDALLTAAGSGINSMRDLVGKKVATPPFTSSLIVWPVLLKQLGIDPNSVTLIKAEPGTIPGLLATGQVDAIFTWATTAPMVYPALTTVGKTPKLILWSSSGYEGYSQTILASNKMIAERPEVIKRFLKVMKKSLQAVNENPQLGIDAIKAIVPQADLAVLKVQVDGSLPYFFNEITQKEGLFALTQDRVKTSWDWVSRAKGFAPTKINPMTTVDTRFIPQ
jgi:NitT/TauT family transport system substrate-binding protein